MVAIVNDNYDCIQVFYARIYNMATIPIKNVSFILMVVHCLINFKLLGSSIKYAQCLRLDIDSNK